MKVKIKKLSPLAKIPVKAHTKDFCYDVYATSCDEVESGIWRYSLGLAFEIERDNIPLYYPTPDTVKYLSEWYYSNFNLSIDFRPRSSIWKTGLSLCNCEGTIDELYRGEVVAYFYEVVKGRQKYQIGDRIGQIKLGITLPLEFVEEEINEDTERGTKGFGSSGLK